MVEIWSKKVGASEFHNVERKKPLDKGGGQLYFQVDKSRVPDLLKFLRRSYPERGQISINVRAMGRPDVIERLQFWNKSQGRMRTGRQNRYPSARPNEGVRLTAWSPALGFPSLPVDATLEDARSRLAEAGGVRIYLARDDAGEVYAGFTKGEAPPPGWGDWPFNNILFGRTRGGYWRAE